MPLFDTLCTPLTEISTYCDASHWLNVSLMILSAWWKGYSSPRMLCVRYCKLCTFLPYAVFVAHDSCQILDPDHGYILIPLGWLWNLWVAPIVISLSVNFQLQNDRISCIQSLFCCGLSCLINPGPTWVIITHTCCGGACITVEKA